MGEGFRFWRCKMQAASGNGLVSNITRQETRSLYLCLCLFLQGHQGLVTGALCPMASFNGYFPEISLLSTTVRLKPTFSRLLTEMAKLLRDSRLQTMGGGHRSGRLWDTGEQTDQSYSQKVRLWKEGKWSTRKALDKGRGVWGGNWGVSGQFQESKWPGVRWWMG